VCSPVSQPVASHEHIIFSLKGYNTTVQVSEECIPLLRSLSQPDKFISQSGVFRAGN
jgi:hypothetical protein